jgi:hypothetical protein
MVVKGNFSLVVKGMGKHLLPSQGLPVGAMYASTLGSTFA